MTKPMGGLWFTNSFGYQPGREVSRYDPARAKQLLKEAGYPQWLLHHHLLWALCQLPGH